MHDEERTANLLGAMALAVTDLAVASVTVAGTSNSGAAAMVVLMNSPGLSATELGRRIGLTQSATARMIDSLTAQGLAEKGPGTGRHRPIELTAAGRDATTRLLGARAESLHHLVDALTLDERRILDGLLAKLLVRVYADVRNSELLCRLCDRAACTGNATCPVGQAERDLLA
jgi:MarR family transcriptional regulator, negative regulator of the multidrug operon emrRAB